MKKLSLEELNRMSVSDYQASEKFPAIVVLDNIRSMLNVGSAFRTADAFRIEGVWLCGITAQPPHREINKTAIGATDSVNWQYFPDSSSAAQKLISEGYTLVTVEQTDSSVALQSFAPEQDQKYAFVFGNEVFGVSDEMIAAASFSLEIPQYGTKHSLNISVSVGIVLWHFLQTKI